MKGFTCVMIAVNLSRNNHPSGVPRYRPGYQPTVRGTKLPKKLMKMNRPGYHATVRGTSLPSGVPRNTVRGTKLYLVRPNLCPNPVSRTRKSLSSTSTRSSTQMCLRSKRQPDNQSPRKRRKRSRKNSKDKEGNEILSLKLSPAITIKVNCANTSSLF